MMAVFRSSDRGSRKRRSRSYGKSAKNYLAETFDRNAEAAYDDWAMKVGDRRHLAETQRGMDRKKHSGSAKGRRVAGSGATRMAGGGVRRHPSASSTTTTGTTPSKPVRKRKTNPSNRKTKHAQVRAKTAAKKVKARSKSTRTRTR